jgi:hypothetical protein
MLQLPLVGAMISNVSDPKMQGLVQVHGCALRTLPAEPRCYPEAAACLLNSGVVAVVYR